MSKDPIKVVFAGTPAFAASALAGLLQNPDCQVIAVYTQPDRPANRGKKLAASEVKTLAVEHNLAIFQPVNFKDQSAIDELKALDADVMIVAAYGLLLPLAVLDTPKLGCLNIHASILPRWRGAAPIERAIEAGDSETGITIMQMNEGLDTGDILHISKTTILSDETGDSLRERLAVIGVGAINHVVSDLANKKPVTGTKQDDLLANYAKKLTKEEAEIDWSLPAVMLDRKIRAFYSQNSCYTYIQQDRLKILKTTPIEQNSNKPAGTITEANKKGITVACGAGQLQLQTLQLPGGKAMESHALLNGKADLFTVGALLGQKS